MSTILTTEDAVDTILRTTPGSDLDQLRRRRPITRENTQASYLALFVADQLSDVSLAERFAVAVFVAVLHENTAASESYQTGLGAVDADNRLLAAVLGAAASGATTGPYGNYKESGLQQENRTGLRWEIPTAAANVLGKKLSAALEHSHLLVFRPRESSPAALNALVQAGWSTTGIVTLSQLVAFLAYQLRIVSGLTVLQATLTAPAATTTPSSTDDQLVRIGS